MVWNRLSIKLLAGAIGLVVTTALAVALWTTSRYSQSLMHSLRDQCFLLGRSLAAEAADLILTNDIVAPQKLVQHQKAIHPDLAYLIVEKDGTVLAHSFEGGFPVNLLNLHDLQGTQIRALEVVSEEGDRFLDIIVPVFEGRAGYLRLGFTEKAYETQMRRLWVQIAAITAVIVLMAVTAISLVIRKLLEPLRRLTGAINRASQGELTVRVEEQGDEEISVLARSFNEMMHRLQESTRRLEKQARDPAAAQQQTKAFCEIVQNIGALRSLQDIGAFLITRFRDVLHLDKAALLLFDDARESILVLKEKDLKTIGDPLALEWFSRFLETLTGHGVPRKRRHARRSRLEKHGACGYGGRQCGLLPESGDIGHSVITDFP